MTTFLSTEGKRVILYYALFCFLFVFLNLLIVSVFIFFHFLLDHDMSTIENWLNRNAWEILTMSKLGSLYFTAKITKLNLVDETKYRDLLKSSLTLPSIKIFGVIVFILIIFYAFITQFGARLQTEQFKQDLFYSSFLGSFFFYFCDFVILYILSRVYPPKDLLKVLYISLVMFVISSKLALPYLNKYYIFLIMHFVTLFYFMSKDNFSDSLLYSLFVIAPLSSLYGLDIVWDSAYSLISYKDSLPLLGIIGIWGLGLGYYHISRSD